MDSLRDDGGMGVSLMARINTSGLSELINDLKAVADDFDDCAHEMINAGADIAVAEWKKGIENTVHTVEKPGGGYTSKTGYIDTGAMLASVGKTQKKSTAAEIYPQGKDGKVRNATKAYVLHYGSSKIRGTRFVDGIDANVEKDGYVAMRDKLDEFLKQYNL